MCFTHEHKQSIFLYSCFAFNAFSTDLRFFQIEIWLGSLSAYILRYTNWRRKRNIAKYIRKLRETLSIQHEMRCIKSKYGTLTKQQREAAKQQRKQNENDKDTLIEHIYQRAAFQIGIVLWANWKHFIITFASFLKWKSIWSLHPFEMFCSRNYTCSSNFRKSKGNISINP